MAAGGATDIGIWPEELGCRLEPNYAGPVRWLTLVAGLLLMGCAASAGAENAPSTRLTVRGVGAEMEFRTLGLRQTGFTLADGGSRSWNLRPGRYVVVQAPPWGGGLQISCSDGVSMNEYIIEAGDADLTCTFTALP